MGSAPPHAKGGAEFELVSLKDFDLPVFSSATLPAMADKSYDSEQVQAWSRVIDDLDGYIFVTPEYNRSVPGPFKNAFDCLAAEWAGKPVAFVGYGPSGAVRAIEAWRQLAGGTDPVSKAAPGSIRGDFALSVGENIVHGSDSPESAEREIAIWFPNL